jgi:hypothetical protein
MDSSRLPRFQRSPSIVPLHLTERDGDIIRLVHQHRFLRSSHIVALMGGSSQQIIRRLQLLFHHGFLERSRAQIDYYHRGKPRALVYGSGNKGGTFIRQERDSTASKLSWGEKNRAVGRIFLEHALLVSDVMVALELACRKTGRIRLLAEEELSLSGKRNDPRPGFQWKVKVTSGLTLGVVPDRVFALEFPNPGGGSNRAYFFLEADRGTMPVKRRHLFQSSFYRKLLAYEATWSQSVHRTRFGFNRFRVLTVTTSAARVDSLVDACSTLKRGHGLFLFADFESLQRAPSILTHPWHTTRPGVEATLLD